MRSPKTRMTTWKYLRGTAPSWGSSPTSGKHSLVGLVTVGARGTKSRRTWLVEDWGFWSCSGGTKAAGEVRRGAGSPLGRPCDRGKCCRWVRWGVCSVNGEARERQLHGGLCVCVCSQAAWFPESAKGEWRAGCESEEGKNEILRRILTLEVAGSHCKGRSSGAGGLGLLWLQCGAD